MPKSSEPHHYLYLRSEPHITDELTVRLALQDALTATFGLVYAGAPVDVVSLPSQNEDGEDFVVIQVASGDVKRVMAAVTAFTGRPRLSVVKISLGSDESRTS